MSPNGLSNSTQHFYLNLQFKHKKAGGSCQGEHKWDCVCTSDPSKNSITDDDKPETETKSKNEKLTQLEWITKTIENHQKCKFRKTKPNLFNIFLINKVTVLIDFAYTGLFRSQSYERSLKRLNQSCIFYSLLLQFRR